MISTAYERTSVIVTTNLPFEQWTEVLGSERLTGAVLDRLTHRCHILESNGESYRLKDARRRVGVLDHQRQSFLARYWPDRPLSAELFHLTLNASILTDEEIADAIATVVKSRENVEIGVA